MNIKPIFLLFFIIFCTFSCEKSPQPRNIQKVTIQEINIDSASIRAIGIQKDSSVFYATSKGTVGLVAFTGKILQEQQISYDTLTPHFRAIASNGEYLFALNIGNPALLYKLNNGRAELVYKEGHEKVFYDALAFFDMKNGIAMGDPTDDCLSIILTNDGGTTWHKVPCSSLPKTKEGEAAFAASNGNIAISGKNAWLVTGGSHSRVFYTRDMGVTWQVFDSPITQGKQMTGIYSIDFYDSKNGIIFGGDWSDKKNTIANKAITNDGGETWHLVADGREPGYKSAVRYVPDTEGKELFAVGSTGVSFSNNSGKTWRKVSDEGYYTIRFVNKNVAWLAGKNRLGKMVLE